MRFENARFEAEKTASKEKRSVRVDVKKILRSPILYGGITLAVLTSGAGLALNESVLPKVDPAKFPGYEPTCDTGTTNFSQKGFEDRTLVYYGPDKKEPKRCLIFAPADIADQLTDPQQGYDMFYEGLGRALPVDDKIRENLGVPEGEWVIQLPNGVWVTNIPEEKRTQNLAKK